MAKYEKLKTVKNYTTKELEQQRRELCYDFHSAIKDLTDGNGTDKEMSVLKGRLIYKRISRIEKILDSEKLKDFEGDGDLASHTTEQISEQEKQLWGLNNRAEKQLQKLPDNLRSKTERKRAKLFLVAKETQKRAERNAEEFNNRYRYTKEW